MTHEPLQRGAFRRPIRASEIAVREDQTICRPAEVVYPKNDSLGCQAPTHGNYLLSLDDPPRDTTLSPLTFSKKSADP